MLAKDLRDLFRQQTVDTEEPYLWSDLEVYLYMAEAYRTFVRLTGGIPDTSDGPNEAITKVPIVAGNSTSPISPLILKFRTCYAQSDQHPIDVINNIEESKLTSGNFGASYDYGNYLSNVRNNSPGRVTKMIVGNARGLVRWVLTPKDDDVALLDVYRLPLDYPDQSNADSYMFPEIGEEHHFQLLKWMMHLAYSKQDTETFDKGKTVEFANQFANYCDVATREWDRHRSTRRLISYGGY